MPSVLIVEDDAELAEKLRLMLTHERYVVDVIEDGEQAAYVLKNSAYDLIVLDWHLPNVTGVELCKRFRQAGGTTAVLMLTGESTVNAKECGLDAGADDYLTKPFHPKELMARVRALLRRPREFAGNTLKLAELTIDLDAHSVQDNGREIKLLPLEFALLEYFMRHPNQVFSLEIILERVWPRSSDATVEAARTYVKTLRKKLADAGASVCVGNVHGVGYKLEASKES